MRPHTTRRAAAAATMAGADGSLACTVAMTAALAGAFGAGAAAGARAITARHSMSGMATPGGPLGDLMEFGPQILAVSAPLVTAGLARRRPLAATPAAAAGALPWWGMYAQASLTVMYTALALAYPAWTATWLWTRPRRDTPSTAVRRGPQ